MITKFVGFYRENRPDIITGLTLGDDIYGLRQNEVRHDAMIKSVMSEGVPLENISVCGIFDMETDEVVIDARGPRAMDEAMIFAIITRHLKYNPVYKRIRLERNIPAVIAKVRTAVESGKLM